VLNQKGACPDDKVILDHTIRYAIFWSLPLESVKYWTIIAIQVVDRRGRRRVLLRTLLIIFEYSLLLTIFLAFCSAGGVRSGQVGWISSDCLLLGDI
jgi:hypothetical protein